MAEKNLRDMLIELDEKSPQENLVVFFRDYDHKSRWVVGPNIDKEIKKYVSLGDKQFK